jgi:hypothetical protein
LNKMKNRSLKLIIVFMALILQATLVSSVAPNGATTSPGASTTAPSDPAGSANAQAGNVTNLNIFGYSTTQSWQGFFGNVSGTIELANANNKTLYNWSLASPEGEVYASTNSSIVWTNIQCFNFTAIGNGTNEAGHGGTTNLYGTNLTNLETRFSISSDDPDGVNETFTFPANGHDLFYAAGNQFSDGECPSTKVFSSSGPVNDQFEEVLLYEPTSSSVVFASLLEKNLVGFDSSTYDFEMLVLENGHGTDTSSTPYYFYVELE